MTTWISYRGNWRILSLALLAATLAAPHRLPAQDIAAKLSFVYPTKRYSASDLVTRPLIGRSVTRLTEPDSFCLEPAISADDKLGGDLMLYDTETKRHTQLTAAEGPMWGPRAAWLPLKSE